jgi:CubicO group peptidase (beta-lactamase class C family)
MLDRVFVRPLASTEWTFLPARAYTSREVIMPLLHATLLAVLLGASVPASSPAPDDPGGRLDRWLVRAGFQGSALVVKGHTVWLRKGYGMSDREAGVPYDADTVFSLGSITKQFTAAAILKLEMQGKLSVEDPIAKFLPGVPEEKRGITIHRLLTHTSGLDSDFADDFEPVGRDAYVARVLGGKLLSKPGAAYRYSNAGYSLLGAIIEIASGRPYERYLSENLLLPAGMGSTGYRLPKWDPKKIAVGYRDGKRWGRLTEKPWGEEGPYWALRANGAIHTTLDDMLKWHRALQNDAVLSAPERAKMFAKQVAEEPGSDSFYGYGWAIRDEPGAGRIVSHNGGNGVFYAELIRLIDADALVVVSTNDSTIRGGRIAEGLARMVLGGEVPVPEKRGAAAGAPVAASPLGTEGRDAIVRAWLDAFNAPGPDAMRAFRKERAVPRPGVTDAERDRQLERMRGNFGRLEGIVVVARGARDVTVRAKGSNGPAGTFRFLFAADDRVEGVEIELGE